jgi:hypothetical protein
MTPRKFFNALKTRSGKLVVFGVVFGGGMLLLSVLRNDGNNPANSDFRKSTSTNRADKSQVVETVERNMDLFRPPQPRPETPLRFPRFSTLPRLSPHQESRKGRQLLQPR